MRCPVRVSPFATRYRLPCGTLPNSLNAAWFPTWHDSQQTIAQDPYFNMEATPLATLHSPSKGETIPAIADFRHRVPLPPRLVWPYFVSCSWFYGIVICFALFYEFVCRTAYVVYHKKQLIARQIHRLTQGKNHKNADKNSVVNREPARFLSRLILDRNIIDKEACGLGGPEKDSCK